MGDRANIEIVYPAGFGTDAETSIHLYTHWLAYETPKLLARAIEVGRTDDEPYMGRTIITQFVKAHGDDDVQSLGVAPYFQDGVKYRVHLGNKTVEVPDQTSSFNDQRMLAPVGYEQFVADVASGKDYGYGL